MPATLPLPAGAGVYQGMYPVFVDQPFGKPDEGYKRIPASIAWGTDDLSGAVLTGAVQFALAGRVSEFHQIGGMYIDNTQSGADVQIVFPEAQFEFTCAAGEKDYFQIASPSLNFYISSPSALNTDKTYLQIFNYAPRPLTAYKSVFMSSGIVSALNLTGNGTSSIVASGNGTITGISLSVSGISGGDATSVVRVQLIDGANNVLAEKYIVGLAANSVPLVTLFETTSINLRFKTGLSIKVIATGTAFTAGVVSGTVYYRMP